MAAQLRLTVQGRLVLPRALQQQGTCWFYTGGPVQLRGEGGVLCRCCSSRCWTPPPHTRCWTSPTAAGAGAAAGVRDAATSKSRKTLDVALRRRGVAASIRQEDAAKRATPLSPTNQADARRSPRGRGKAAGAGGGAGSPGGLTRNCAVVRGGTSTPKVAAAEEAAAYAAATGGGGEKETMGGRADSEGPAPAEPAREEATAEQFDRRTRRAAGSTAGAAEAFGKKAYYNVATTEKMLLLAQPRRWVSAWSSAGRTAAFAVAQSVAGSREQQQQRNVSGSSSRIESSVADALSARVEHQEAVGEEILAEGLKDKRQFVLDTGEIVPAAFTAAKQVKDFRLLPVGRLLQELRTRRQELLLEWQRSAEFKIRSASAAAHARNGQGNEAITEAHEREQRLLQQRVLLLHQLILPLPPAVHEQVPFMSASQVVCCLLHLTALIEAAAGLPEATEITPKAADAGTETAASAAPTDVSDPDFLQLQHQWYCCCTRLKDLVLDAEESVLVLHCVSTVAAADVDGLLSALVERIEAAYFSMDVQSSPLVHPVFCVWQPRCLTFAAAVNCLPLAYKARLVHQDAWLCPRLDDNGGWQPQPKEEEPKLPTWQTMQPVDMEAYEKKHRRVVRTRFVQAKVLRQTDGRKLAAAFALHARLAICDDADLDSLVACAAVAAAAPVRPFRGNFLTESLDLLAAELLRRPVAEIVPAVLPLTSLLAGVASFPLKQQLFAHLAAAARTWLSRRTPEEQTETPLVQGAGAAARAVTRKDELLLLQQLQHVPFNLQLLFGFPYTHWDITKDVVRKGEMLGGSSWFRYKVNRHQRKRREDLHQTGDAAISPRTAAQLFARLLCNFLFVEAYRAPYSLLVLLSRHLLQILQSTSNGSNDGHNSGAQSDRSVIAWRGSSRTGGSDPALGEEATEQFVKKCALPLSSVAAIFDGAVTAGFAHAPLLHELLRQLQYLPRRRLVNEGSSAAGAACRAACAATKSCEALALWEGTPSDLAVLLQSLVTLSPARVHPPARTGHSQPQQQRRQQKPLQKQQKIVEEFYTLRNEFAVCAWEVLRPLLSRLRKDTRLLIFNSLCSLNSSPYSSSLHKFEEALQAFLEDFPEFRNVNAVGTFFNNG